MAVSVTTPTDTTAATAARGIDLLPDDQETALFGFLQTFVELTRAIDQALSGRHDVALAGYEVLNRLARAGADGMRMTDLAEGTSRSLSRVSRLVDDLAARGLVTRRACRHDKRSSYIALTEPGRELTRAAQETFLAAVQERFLSRISPEETRVLSEVFGRLASGDGSCRTALTT